MSRTFEWMTLNPGCLTCNFTSPPQAFELAGLAADGHPALHEWQICSNILWHLRQEQRIREHRRRVDSKLNHDQRSALRQCRRGKAQATWCVELRRVFRSVAEAGRFIDRAPSNICRAIHTGSPCGSYHWEKYDPSRHL